MIRNHINELVLFWSKVRAHAFRLATSTFYIRGRGIEIGALHNPLPVPKWAKVKYVDRFPESILREHYPELRKKKLVNVDFICDGEFLASVHDRSQDFVIANHFLEHCENPILSVENILRVLREDGIAYIALPDKRFTFDEDRPVTSLDHVKKDYEEGPVWSKKEHFEEWTRLVAKIHNEDKAQQHSADLMKTNYSIHYHVWTQKEILELMLYLRDIFEYEIELFLRNSYEIIMILRVTGSRC